jgi:hypothetical protein
MVSNLCEITENGGGANFSYFFQDISALFYLKYGNGKKYPVIDITYLSCF